MSFHRQCELTRGVLRTATWIPESFAKKGKLLKLKDREGAWTDGWKVTSVGARLSTSEALEREQDYKHQREASDI